MKKPVIPALLILGLSVALAQTTPSTPSTPSTPTITPPSSTATPSAPAVTTPALTTSPLRTEAPAAVDALFMQAASMSNWNEIVSSQGALGKAIDPAVKTYAQQMVNEHTPAQAELTALAARKGVSIPQDPGVQNRLVINYAAGLEGAAFERKYLEAQIAGHQATVAFFLSQIRDGRDPDVVALAQKLLPTIQMHLDMARRLYQSGGRTMDMMNMSMPMTTPSSNTAPSSTPPAR